MTITGFLVIVIVSGACVGLTRAWHYLVRRALDDQPDPALVIKPPRRFVDADGRSDFRPERYDRYLGRGTRDLVRLRVAASRVHKDGRNA